MPKAVGDPASPAWAGDESASTSGAEPASGAAGLSGVASSEVSTGAASLAPASSAGALLDPKQPTRQDTNAPTTRLRMIAQSVTGGPSSQPFAPCRECAA